MARGRGIAPSALLLAAMAATPALAQSALQGKRLYQDVGRLRGAGISCVDCHGGMPGGLHGIGRAAGDPGGVAYALGAIRQMEPLRGRLTEEDMADIAAYLAAPDVAAPEPRLSTGGPAASPYGAERLEFGEAASGSSSPASTIQLVNRGAVPLRILSAPELHGPAAGDFRLAGGDCVASMALAEGQSCSIHIAFEPRGGGESLRTATISLAHDWIRGGTHVALIGRVASPAPGGP